MYKSIKNLAFAAVLGSALALSANAQTEKKVIVNSDGSYSVIEYPVDKNVDVRLLPMSGINGTGMARVVRTANGTKVVFDVKGAPADWKNVYAYTVDPMGASTFLGPIAFSDGTGKAEFMTPSNQFMLVLSPNEGLTSYDPTTTYVFRSEVPTGYTVVPRMNMGRDAMVGGVKITSTDTVMSSSSDTVMSYEVPLLGIPKFAGKETAVRLNFDGELSGLEAKAYIKPVDGKTQIKMNFDDLQKVPMNKRFVLWTSGPQGYTKIGQVIHVGKKDTSQIKGETALNDFGLFLTVEDLDVNQPTSRIYSSFRVVSP